MKKKQLIIAGCILALAGGLFASCGNKSKEEKTVAIDEMVEAVERPVPGINGTNYNAAFFKDDSKKSETATDSTYATTATGLKYVIAQEGTGKQPTATSEVTVHYVGTLTNGMQFDSSIDRGEPINFPLTSVIPGWTEGLQLMKEGGTAVFYIPSELGYGEQGAFNPYTNTYTIPPSSDLIFWVQLIQVN